MSIRRLALAGLLVLGLPAGLASGEGGPPQPPRQPPGTPPAGVPPQPIPQQPPAGQPPAGAPNPGAAGQPVLGANQALATRLFDEAVRWIARGQPGLQKVRDFYVAMDAKFDLEGTHSEGPMRLWLQVPDLYRQEMTIGNSPQTKILNKDQLWIAGADRKFVNMNRTADAEAALKQARDDLERLVDITDFLTLQGLKGPGVTFESEGEKTPSGVFARPGGGTWWKIVRKAPGRPNIYFWLAHFSDATGVHATFPGVVRVAGEPQNDIATEDYILQNWEDQPTDPKRAFRFPRTIRALQSKPGQPPIEFLRAVVTDIKMNEGIDPSRFLPDGMRPPAQNPPAPVAGQGQPPR